MSIQNDVLKTLLTLTKFNNGQFKTEKQKNFLIRMINKNSNRFFFNTVMYSNIFFIFEYDQFGITKITKETQGKHRSNSEMILTYSLYWERLNSLENEKNNIKLKTEKNKKIKRNIINKNINKLKNIAIIMYRNILVIELGNTSEQLKNRILKDFEDYDYYSIKTFVLSGTNGQNEKMQRIKKLIDKIEKKENLLNTLF